MIAARSLLTITMCYVMLWCPFYPRERSLCVQAGGPVCQRMSVILLSFSVTMR
jgi:hypothetical protein